MAQPTTQPRWANNGGVLVQPASGKLDIGWLPGELPPGQYMNWWMNLVYLWVQYLLATLTMTRTKFPTAIFATNWAASITFSGTDPWLASSGAGDAYVDLDIPQGYKLSTLTLWCHGNAAANLILTPIQVFNDEGSHAGVTNGPVPMGSLTLNALSATGADQTLNMLAASSTLTGGQTVTVAAAGGTYTRSAGSFITDGFFVGQIIAWTGFLNGGNNATKTITALSATVMTVSNAGLVNETGAANTTQANGVSPAIDGTFNEQLKITASATGLGVRNLRYSCVPI